MVEENKEKVERSDLDKLRGPNTALSIFLLVEKYIKSYPAERIDQTRPQQVVESEILRAAKGIQRWASIIDKETISAIASTPPTSKPSLDLIVGELVKNGSISNGLDLLPVIKPHPRLESILPFADYEVSPWLVFMALFDIDNRTVDSRRIRLPKSYKETRVDTTKHDYPVSDYLLELASNAAEKKGYRMEETITQEQAYQPINAYSLPVGIDGVSIILTMIEDPFSFLRTRDANAVIGKGDYYIWNIALRFQTEFLSSVRPLTGEEYQKYANIELRGYKRAAKLKELLDHVESQQQAIKRPTAQELYNQRYANQMHAAIEASRKFRGSEEDWMDSFPDNGEVPPWIWWEIYQRSRGRRV